MPPRDTPPPGTPEALRAELSDVAQALLRNVFKQAGDESERKYPTLARVIKTIVGEQQWRSRPNQSVIDVMSDAIGDLPETLSSRKGRKADQPPLPSRGSPERQIAAVLYGYRDDKVEPRFIDGAEMPKTYDHDYLPAALILANAESSSERAQRRIPAVIREDLADKLLEMERNAVERRELPAAIQDEPDQVLIDRHEYTELLQRHIDAGQLVLCIWGEPGTGKTTLAKQFAASLAGSAPILTIRTAPQVTGPTSDAEIYRRDLIGSFITEGLDPATWQPDTYLVKLCERIGSQPRSGAVVIDNVSDDDLIERLVQSQPKIPVIIAMREEPSIAGIVCEQLHDFTEDQACEFITGQLPGQNGREVLALARILGYRPLALEHAVLSVKDPQGITLKSLIDSLATNITDAISTVTPPEQRERNLIKLYKLILASLIENEENKPAQSVLDNFLAIVGHSGTGRREIVYTFMHSEQGGSHDRLHFLAGLKTLKRRGLIHEQQQPVRIPHREDEGSRATAELSMHALTYQILRALRSSVPLEIEMKYVNFLHDFEDDISDEDPIASLDRAYMNLIGWSMRAVESTLPRGWKALDCIDRTTWIALKESLGNDGSAEPHVVRYVNRINEVHKLDCKYSGASGRMIIR